MTTFPRYETKKEKTGKRNPHYDLRHRIYGEMKMYDADNIEFHCETRMPVGVVETKFGRVSDIDLYDDQFTCLDNVATKLEVPFFCLIYYVFSKHGGYLEHDGYFIDFEHIQFYAIPVNKKAQSILPRAVRMTEVEWVTTLYQLRGDKLPEYVKSKLCSTWRSVSNIPFVMPRLYQPEL